jgi:hypothetical protein
MTEIDLDQLELMGRHFRLAGWRLFAEWHSHVAAGHGASQPDRHGWISQASARGLAWLGAVVEPRVTWHGSDWDRPVIHCFLAKPGETSVAPVPVVIETRSRP